MPKSVAKAAAPRSSPRGVPALEKAVRHLVGEKKWGVGKPLPTTREYGDRFGISNASVCRLLKRLGSENVIWRRPNGRYYLKESRHLLERRRPFACLLRKLQHWSHMYQAIMTGFSQAFGRKTASMLFVHNESLVRHADTAHPPVHAGVSAQREALAEFFHHHDDQFAGILLDDVWLDEAIAKFSNQLENAVVVGRTTTLPALCSVSVDFEASARLAMGHLHARGFEEILIAVPFSNSAPVDLMLAAATHAAAALGPPLDPQNICSAATPDDRAQLIERLKKAKRRTGVFCLEDNVSLLLHRAIVQAGIECPRRVGLMSGMGDIVIERGISSVKIDYELIGRIAGEQLISKERRSVGVPAALVPAQTT
ncbi:MAG TPA: substrate-binding domain-containing protein [Opitutaceae bacterium]|nr:substrate-binding domain-containing protein [Opitutaceae bacterium]